jgi:GMC oxidoreductase
MVELSEAELKKAAGGAGSASFIFNNTASGPNPLMAGSLTQSTTSSTAGQSGSFFSFSDLPCFTAGSMRACASIGATRGKRWRPSRARRRRRGGRTGVSGSIRHITAAPEPSDLWIGRSTCARCGTTMTGQYGLRIPRITYSWSDNDKRLIQHALDQMERHLRAAGAKEIFRQEDDTNHLHGTARMGDDPRTSVVNADCRSWDIRNL